MGTAAGSGARAPTGEGGGPMGQVVPQTPTSGGVGVVVAPAATSAAASPWLAVATAGLLIGVIEVVLALSFAGLIFSGPLRMHLPVGVGAMLASGAALLACTAVLSSRAAMAGSLQDTVAAVLALGAAGIARAAPPERHLATVLALMALTAAAMGVLMLCLGGLRLGNLVRFVPHPVMGGFLAGTGWLLVQGGMAFLTDLPLAWSTLGRHTEAAVVTRWLPGLAVALLLVVLVRRTAQVRLVPLVLLGCAVVFYGVLAAVGVGITEAGERGWLLGPFPADAAWGPPGPATYAAADLSALLGQLAAVATLLIVAPLGMLLNATGIELAGDGEADLDRELRTAGATNLAVAALGGAGGYHALSLTALASKLRAQHRAVGLIAAGLCVLTLLVGGGLLASVPRAVLGGLLLFLGLSFLLEWVWDARRSLPRGEHAVVLAILLVVASVGYLQGVALGVVLAVALFVTTYSRTDVVTGELSGAAVRSNVDRPAAQRALLRSEGDAIRVLRLQGFLFFGTANALLERVSRSAGTAHRLGWLVLDLHRVSGVDSSVVYSLAKLHRRLRNAGAVLVLSGLSPQVERRLHQAELLDECEVLVLPDLDHALEWCEEALLARSGQGPQGRPPLADILPPGCPPDVLLAYLEPVSVDSGEVLLRQGAGSDELYLLTSGRLSVEMSLDGGGHTRLRTAGPGAVVGEIGLLRGTPRTATAVALEPVEALRLTRARLDALERETPAVALLVHRWLASLLAERLADADRALGAVLA